MFTWEPSCVEPCRRDDDRRLACFAVAQSDRPVRLELRLHANDGVAPALVASPPAGRIPPVEPLGDGRFRILLVVEPSDHPDEDDEVRFEVRGAGGPACEVVLRRSACALSLGLLDPDGFSDAARRRWPQTEAALRWFGWRRFRELVGIKRFTSGHSGKDVFVFRPRLRAPADGPPRRATSHPDDVLGGTWGAWLLVKSGPRDDVAQEWDRFQAFLRDRLHPFLARSEGLFAVRPADEAPAGADGPCATLVSSFLGGDLIRTEPLEEVLGGADHFDVCQAPLDHALDLLAPWHAASQTRPLGAWRRVYHPGPPTPPGADAADWLLFGKFDLSRKDAGHGRRGIRAYAGGLLWDVDFVREAHLHHHLLGRPADHGADLAAHGLRGPRRDGLLPHLATIKARYSLIHGDFHAGNVLCQDDNAWLIDFEHTGVGPALADYARLEVNLRLWGLSLAPGGDDVAAVAEQFERCLLDHFHGGASGLGRVRSLAAGLGADPDKLLKVARCIAHVRARAAAYCVEDYADRRDYLAVLFLTTLSLLPKAAAPDAAPPANFRLLVGLAWVLEDALCRLLGRALFVRRRATLDPAALLARDGLAEDGAPGRVVYLLDRPDGRRALAALAACRGVVQNDHHHLDVLDHTLLVLANVEALLADPVGGLLDPAGLDGRAAAALAGQGVRLPPIPAWSRAAAPAAAPRRPADLEAFLGAALDDKARLLLKWLAVLHDVGKPGTRGLHDGRVQFIGHEVYGRQLVNGLLERLFPEPELRERLSRLIIAHHRFHQIVAHFAEPSNGLEALARGLAEGQAPKRESAFLARQLDPAWPRYEPDFVLLMLHGYADRLAGRGRPLGPTAEAAWAVLTYCARYTA